VSSHPKPRSVKRSPDGGANDPLHPRGIADVDHIYAEVGNQHRLGHTRVQERLDDNLHGFVARLAELLEMLTQAAMGGDCGGFY
jgi:hypothetical protein